MRDQGGAHFLPRLRTREEVLELWKLGKLRLAYHHGGIGIPEFTCVDCASVRKCKLAFDLYNTNGDCLLSK